MCSLGEYSYIVYDTPCGAFHLDLIFHIWESSPTDKNRVSIGWLHFLFIHPPTPEPSWK